MTVILAQQFIITLLVQLATEEVIISYLVFIFEKSIGSFMFQISNTSHIRIQYFF